MMNCNDCIHKEACAVYSKNLNDVILHGVDCKGYVEKPKKPTIRHCKNCQWAKYGFSTDSITCTVKYTYHWAKYQRIIALFCRYYCKKEGIGNE